ncbi:MAG TPA: extracellular solute-binding protein [Chloroflexota bacterium]|nr:extracellular solute-binding protein [Chloroflexota bacterium]
MRNERYVSRRTFLSAFAAGASALALGGLAACGGSSAAPASSSASAAAKASGSGDWQAQWNSWIDGAKKEGKLVFGGPPSQDARVQLPEAFNKAFGVTVEYIGGPSSDLANRIRSEQSAGQSSVDVTLSGSDTTYLVLYGQHMTEPVKPWLIRPDVLDPKAWIHGSVWYMDPEQQYIVRASNYLSQLIWVNTDQVKADAITAWHDLIKPEYKGKIIAYDPVKNGSGAQMAAFVWTKFGEDFAKQLFIGQDVKIVQDYTQLGDNIARGTYPIALAGRGEDLEKLKSQGFKVQALGPMSDAPSTVSAGFGLTNMIKNPPHPNAAKLFVNWILTKDGQTVWNNSQKTASVRTDVDNSWLKEDIVPKAGQEYFDTYDWDYTLNGYPKANKAIKDLLAK